MDLTAPQFLFIHHRSSGTTSRRQAVQGHWFFILSLADLQRSYGKGHTQYRRDPKSCHDLALMISQLLIMMMQGAHQKDPPSLAVFFLCVFKVSHLYHYAEILHEEHSTEYRYQPFLPDDDGQRGDHSAQHKAASVAHEYLRRES